MIVIQNVYLLPRKKNSRAMYEILLLVCATIHCSGLSHASFMVVTAPNDPCPGESGLTQQPCLTLTEFVSRSYDPSLLLDVTLDLQPGKHEILHSLDLQVENLRSFVLRATGKVILDCRNRYFNIRDTERVQISGIKFVNCTNNIVIKSVIHFSLVNSSLSNSQRLWIRDTEQATITKSNFSEGRQTLYVSQTSVNIDQCILSANCIAVYGENSHITVNQSVFRMNRANCIAPPTQLLRSGGAISLVLDGDDALPLTIFNSTFEGNTACTGQWRCCLCRSI